MSCRSRWQNLNPYELHKTLINEHLTFTKNRSSLFQRDMSTDKKDIDIIKENYHFVWEESKESKCLSWEKRLAKKYYDKLYKEYCIGDLSKYKENKIGMRWRTEQELIDGKGQFSCGSKKCIEKKHLKTWEVNFGYVEEGIKKNALVKLRLCPDCSCKLNYHHKKKEVKRLKQSKHKPKYKSSTSEASKHKKNNKKCEKSKVENNKTVNLEKKDDNSIWKSNNTLEDEEKSREEEFDSYLDQLFL